MIGKGFSASSPEGRGWALLKMDGRVSINGRIRVSGGPEGAGGSKIRE
jgi:hypothetical protein